MADLRERLATLDEAIRIAIRGEFKRRFTSLRVIVEKDGDGHVTSLRAVTKVQVRQPDGKTKAVELPIFADVPIKYPGGGDVAATHPVKKGDEGTITFMSRGVDAWRQSGGVQMPLDTRIMSLSDGVFTPGGRSDPKKLKNVSDDSWQARSVDGKQTTDVHPTKGITNKSVDPSDTAENPFKDATTFHETSATPSGAKHRSVKDGKETGSSGSSHAGAAMSADEGKHVVQALAGAGVKLISTTAIQLSCPAGGLSLPAGGVGAGAMAAGAAALNIGALGGDLEEQLPNPIVRHVTRFSGFADLPNCPNDAAAAAAGVEIEHPYRDGSKLCFRVA